MRICIALGVAIVWAMIAALVLTIAAGALAIILTIVSAAYVFLTHL